MNYDDKLLELGIKLPTPYPAGGNYVTIKSLGENLLYTSGTGGDVGDFYPQGSIGREFTIEEGQMISRNAILNILAGVKEKYGTLNNIKSFVKMTVFVNSADGFYEQHLVANGATDALVEIFGREVGLPTRSAVGMYALPDRMPVEIECLIELNK